jgi:O-antigen/teichoic acid export membrane protein
MDTASVGIYKVVFQLSTVAAFITGILGSVLWPRINRWWKQNDKKLIEKSLSRAFSYSLALAVPISIGGIMLGDKILYYLYGREFVIGYSAFVILLGVQIVNVFQNFFILYLDALYFLKKAFSITAIAAVLNIILNIIFIPRFGIVGGAVSILCSMLISTILAWKILSMAIIIKIEWRNIWNIIFATILMAVYVGGIRILIPPVHAWELCIHIGVGGIIFVFVMLKLDKKIWKELSGMFTQMNVVNIEGG